MAQPLFTVPLSDIERNDVSLSWPIPADWLDAQLTDTEAKSQGKSGALSATLSKNGREILVQAKATVDVVMPCARTLDPVPLTLDAQIQLLLAPKGAPRATRAEEHPTSRGQPFANPPAAKKGRSKGRHSQNLPQEEDEQLADDDAARDTYEGDQIVLDDFVREHIVLELPLFPLRSDLRSEDSPAIRPPPVAKSAEAAVDPRLAPLAAIAQRLREKKE